MEEEYIKYRVSNNGLYLSLWQYSWYRKHFPVLCCCLIRLLSIIMPGSKIGLIYIKSILDFRKREKHRLLFITLLISVFVFLKFLHIISSYLY